MKTIRKIIQEFQINIVDFVHLLFTIIWIIIMFGSLRDLYNSYIEVVMVDLAEKEALEFVKSFMTSVGLLYVNFIERLLLEYVNSRL